MGRSVNKVFLVGNLGRDPEVRSTKSGSSVCDFSVATSESWKGRDGEWQEKTEWHNIVVFGPQADRLGEKLHKGSMVHVEGSLQTEKWEDRSGNKRSTTKIKAWKVTDLSPRESGGRGGYQGGSDGGGYRGRDSGGGGYDAPADGGGFEDEDIPF